ncbi:HTTM domain-containing protein [Taibaiella soli]|uniref:HTTM domain-containing protein n=1 Tax=Taibaiella soli TaxID=1649169 RepID=A0A2W2AGE6_9BACT|nr:HTTM domain-containing protein [Taibaiella soli]PZF74555.1 HTTM domain-containing protein [Taibaiella soli]
MLRNFTNRLFTSFTEDQPIAPLAVLRIAFGAIMLISTIRFVLKGWVHDFYIAPKYFFSFVEWIRPMGAAGMYSIFALMAIACFCIMTGLFYRLAVGIYFLCFCYVELLDKTYYLNHYYFVSIFAFLLFLVPANRYFSLDVLRKPSLKVTHVSGWTINVFKTQLCIVYFFAGVSKLTYEWMIQAMPLRIWLPAHSQIPVIGGLLTQSWVAYAFSWFGAIFDLVIWIFLLKKSTTKYAYIFVLVFHVFTAWFFKIGMFPYIMICVTMVFFSSEFHQQLINRVRNTFGKKNAAEPVVAWHLRPAVQNAMCCMLVVYFFFQLILPFRYLLYPGTLLWTEEGYRFSWRVMLMEKGGTAFFYVKDPATGGRSEIDNARYLTPMQQQMMETQPDMILQYAHFLSETYKKKGIKDPVVTVESYVTLNGSGSRLFIDSTVDLAKEYESFQSKKWILPFQTKK